MLRNDVTWLEACLSLGWKPADDDDAEDADAGDDADVRFRLIFLSGTKSNYLWQIFARRLPRSATRCGLGTNDWLEA